jgi:hypothetical protein
MLSLLVHPSDELMSALSVSVSLWVFLVSKNLTLPTIVGAYARFFPIGTERLAQSNSQRMQQCFKASLALAMARAL